MASVPNAAAMPEALPLVTVMNIPCQHTHSQGHDNSRICTRCSQPTDLRESTRPPEPQGAVSDLDEVSHDICIPARLPFTISASHLADEVTSFYITRHDHYGLGTGKKANSNLDRRFQGPKVILYDM
jgi:hypothetical protein